MLRRSTWLLVLIFGIVLGLALLFQRYQGNKPASTATITPTSALTNLYELGGKQVNQVKITDNTGKQISMYLDSTSKKWAITDLPADQADAFQIESINAQLFDLQAKETLTETPPLDAIGLATPAYTITMITDDGAQLITYVGSPVPTGSGYYVRVGSGLISIVDKVVMDDILKMLANPPLLATPTPEVTPTETPAPTAVGTQVTPTP